MDIGKIIYNRRKELNLTLEDVGNAVGVGKSTVRKWEVGIIENIKRDKIAKLAEVLQISPVILINGDDNFKSPTITDDIVTFPIIGEIAAGYEEIAIEDWSGDTIDIPISYLNGRKKDDYFVLTVNGDSMYPHYQNGDIVLVLKQSTLDRSGDIGAIIYDGECATLKKIEFVKGENWLKLIPLNPEFKPKLIEGSDLETCRIIGIPKLLLRKE